MNQVTMNEIEYVIDAVRTKLKSISGDDDEHGKLQGIANKFIDELRLCEKRLILECAKTAHEVNRAYCEGIGDTSQEPWCDAPDWQRESCIAGVRGVLFDNNTPEQSHESWMKQKLADGWKYDPVKDPGRKLHPCLVPYAELPEGQKVKDHLFVTTVKGVAANIRANGFMDE